RTPGRAVLSNHRPPHLRAPTIFFFFALQRRLTCLDSLTGTSLRHTPCRNIFRIVWIEVAPTSQGSKLGLGAVRDASDSIPFLVRRSPHALASWFYAHRVAGRDRDHRGPDRPAVAGRAVRPRGGPTFPVRE